MNNSNVQLNILVTGAAGFIGSCMVQYLNENGYLNLYLVDDFGVEAKRKNWESKQRITIIERYNLFNWFVKEQPQIDCIIHLGARTDTTEFNYEVHRELNYNYSVHLWQYAATNKIPLIYASSAATYGDGSLGYDDNHEVIEKLQPLNPYGESKNQFDIWAVKQNNQPKYWAGLKFFNVYGPNEYHKGRMASVIWHSFNQIKNTNEVKLFKSHKAGFEDGKQLRDFIYVKDVVEVIFWMMNKMTTETWKPTNNGLYNLGTGTARTFEDLVKATFAGLNLPSHIVYIDMPLDIKDKYQYFTQANMQKLINTGYVKPFYSLEEGVHDYVKNYLQELKVY